MKYLILLRTCCSVSATSFFRIEAQPFYWHQENGQDKLYHEGEGYEEI